MRLSVNYARLSARESSLRILKYFSASLIKCRSSFLMMSSKDYSTQKIFHDKLRN